MSPTARVARRLTSDPIISKSLNESLARMVRNVHERRFENGERIYRADQDADYLYLVQEGEVDLLSPLGKRVRIDRRFGEEAATDVPHYLSDAIAVGEVAACLVPRTSLVGLNLYNPGLKAEFYFSLLTNFGGERVKEAARKAKPSGKRGSEAFAACGWALAILLPLLILLYGRNFGLSQEVATFLAIFTATVLMWMFELVDEYIPGLFAILATLTLGLAPPRVVLGGFASDGFFMAMSILALGTVVVLSGLSFRFLLWILRYLPNTKTGHNFGLLLTGMLLTPLVPSINGRVSLVTPFLVDMVETVKFGFRGKAATRMAVAAFTGVTLFSAAFMTSRSVNFVIHGLLPAQEQQQFQWLYWVIASAVAAGAMLAVYFAAAALAFRSDETSRLSKEQIDVQLLLLGPVKQREWAAIVAILVFAAGVVTTSVHNVQPPWLGMAILYALLMFGFLRRSEFREKTDWPSLVYLGSLVGIIGAFNHLGLDRWLAAHLGGLGAVLQNDFGLFVALLFVAICVLRLAMPNTATIAICATIFMPMADIAGVNPWVVGFVILLLGDLWFLPYQCGYYLQFAEDTREKRVYDESAFLRFNAFMNFVRLGAVYASIPFWRALGFL
jgi:divalent anion:Na+ symporter, DASS family